MESASPSAGDMEEGSGTVYKVDFQKRLDLV